MPEKVTKIRIRADVARSSEATRTILRALVTGETGMTAATNGISRPCGTNLVQVVFTTKGCISDESRHITTAFAESLLPVLTSISIHCMLGIAAGYRRLVAVDTSGRNHQTVELDRRIRSSDDHMHHVFERIAKAHWCRGLDDAGPHVDKSNLNRSG